MFPLCIKWASLAFLAASPIAAYEFKWDLEEGWAPGGGGGILPYISRIVMCHPQRVGFLRRFGLKTGIDWAHFSLESGMVFEETTEVYERICRFNSKWIKKKEKYANLN